MLETGKLIAGRYEIRSELGGGGGGLVYEAFDRRTETRVALKVLRPLSRQERAATEKFKLEACVPGRVKSEHLVQISDADVDPETQLPFLVMEFLEGRNLHELIEQDGRVEPTQAVQFLKQVASGLDKAHTWKDREGRPAPIVHRDLKPENVYLTYREDGTPLVKILDWGIAKVQSDSVTVSSDFRGTPTYMAPEQLRLPAQVTPATDVWAMGLMAFYLLSGRCYWKSAQRAHDVLPVIAEVGEGPTVLPRRRMRELGVDATLPPAFDEWFMRCVNRQPDRRYQRAGEAARELAAALDVPFQESHPPVDGARSHHFHSPASHEPAQIATLPSELQPRVRDIANSALSFFPKKLRRGYLLGLVGGVFLALLLALLPRKPKHEQPLNSREHPAQPLSLSSSMTAERQPAPVPSATDAEPDPAQAQPTARAPGAPTPPLRPISKLTSALAPPKLLAPPSSSTNETSDRVRRPPRPPVRLPTSPPQR